jgi:ubiquinone/menaquinone biosynthesis C-methylase UbiE
MAQQLIQRIFSYASYLFFEKISPKFQVDVLKNLMDVFYIFYEKIFLHFHIFVAMYFDMYNELIENEISLAGITKNKQVLVIGCGSLPATSLLLAQKTGANIVGIDKDKNAVKDAKTFIDANQLKDKVSFLYSEDLSFDLSKFDIIIIAYGIKQELFIFETLGKKMKDTAKIIYRIPFTTDEKQILTQLNKKSHFIFINKIITPSMGSTVSLLLQKKP